ncbi:MAG: methyltransferase domain-containing protein [Deltaproteobacteria bacterium]|nr:methyltransferase domain-containing protein [Deltaproteobacteria bacterium]
MERSHHESAERIRSSIVLSEVTPQRFKEALLSVPFFDRDAWVDTLLGLGALPDDGPELPRGCVPYLPCPVDALLRFVEELAVGPADVVIDVGSGIGRAAVVLHLLTGASVVGLEVQPRLVSAARELAMRLNLSGCTHLEGDAVELASSMSEGTVFFLYCPFSGERLERVLEQIELIARTRSIRVGCVDMPPLSRPWLTPSASPEGDLVAYRSRTR